MLKKILRYITCKVNKTNKCRTGNAEPVRWYRFELLVENEAERFRLERVIGDHNLSRQDLAIILFGLRVRPEFGKKDFGI